MQFKSQNLVSWEWKQRDPSLDILAELSLPTFQSATNVTTESLQSTWHKVLQFPSMIHTELLAIKAIPNPFIADNEYKVQWVGECDWIYRTTFRVEKVQAKYVLSFDGLDTFTKIYLNGALIGETENMFTRQQIEVDEKILKYDTDNVLAIVFESAWKKGKALEEEYGKRNLWNGDSSRLYVRKAQYHYGWDWGPVLMTCGPWRDVRLEFYTSRISDVYVTSTLSEQNTNADLHIEASIEHATTDAEVKFVVTSPSGSPVKEIVSKIGNDSKAIATISIESPALWWPAGYGAQSLYTVNASIVNKTTKIHSVETKYGIRSVRLVQRPLKDQPGTSFFFEINGKRIFCGGANWIPADSFVTRITDEKYEQWIKLMISSNFSMVRVWGGGIYESNIFYDLCDKYGLLVFQDFMFACGSYPAHPSFLASVKTEAEDNVKRLRNHPSITFWAGNNEDYPLAESMGINYDGNDEVDFEKFPGRKIYERVLKDVTSALCKDIPYAFGSPYGGVNSGDQTIGDIHQWNVWHGSQNPYQQYGILSGRFVSEFGMQGHPHIRTVKCFFPEDADAAQKRPDYHPQSYFVDHHNKASGGDRRLAIYVFENIKLSSMKLEDYVYASQLMQSEAIYWAIRDWRREWKGAEKAYCGGVLVWQINDCWPVTSWATVDFYVRPKPAFFAEKRALARTTVNLCRRRISEKFTAGESPADAKINTTVYTASEATPHKCSVWVSSFDKFKGGKVVVRAFTLAGNLKKEWIGDIGVIDNASVDVMDVDVPVDEETVIGAWLVSKGESVSVVENVGDAIARAVDFPQPLRYVDFVHPKITASSGSKTAGDGWEILDITASTPVKHMIFDAASGEDLEWDDNAVDLVPGEVLKVKVKGRNGGGVVGQWLGGYEVQTEVFQI